MAFGLYDRSVADGGDDFSWRRALFWLTIVLVLGTGAMLFLDWIFNWIWPSSHHMRSSSVWLATPSVILSVFGGARRPLAWLLVLAVSTFATVLLAGAVNELRDLQQAPVWMFHGAWACAAWIGGVAAMGVGRALPRRDRATPASQADNGSPETSDSTDG
ncbi:hypothetical protein [Dactylosporangium sp. NPDC048998]|uniref:hypothetical protein n=1 Tax=Dactylosporangium sp. NPDC048998 TaxID=3363976 RepID=UPI003718707E